MAELLPRHKLASERGPFLLDDDRATSSDHADGIEDGDIRGRSHRTTRLSIAQSLLSALGLISRRRRHGYDPIFAGKGSSRYNNPQGVTSRRRRTSLIRLVTRILFAVPFVILMLFGVVHVLHAAFGREALFWDAEAGEDFLPHWGMPGHSGEGLVRYPTDATRDVLPVPLHSHNDYWRRIPLLDALHWGCTSVEADVWLFDEQLYVGHSRASLARNRTFESLYVKPLVELLDTMNPHTDFVNVSGHGVFDADPLQTLVLLVDFKTNGHQAFPLVSQQLEALRSKGYLTFWDGEKVNSRAVTVIGTGNAPFNDVVSNTTYRDIFFDAPLDKLWEPSSGTPKPRDDELAVAVSAPADPASGQGKVGTTLVDEPFSRNNSYYASTSFTSAVGFVWRGHLSPRQMDIIRGQIRGAKRKGLKARYWDTPSWPVDLRNHVWHVLMKEGADVLNVDDLQAAAMDQWTGRRHHWW